MAELTPKFIAAFPYQKDVLDLPVADLSISSWYCKHFGMTEVARSDEPPTAILERNGTKLGFAVNGDDPTQEYGAAILVRNIHQLKSELDDVGVHTGDFKVEERDGVKRDVFFVVAPDGLCFYFYQPQHSNIQNESPKQ